MMTRDNFNTIYHDLIYFLLESDLKSAPRGMPIRELLSYQFELSNPLNCLCTIKDRKLNYAFSIIEKFEYLSGESKPTRLCHYNSKMKNFLNDKTGEFDGAYGPRIARQLDYVYNLLRSDNDTRQAVININNESDKHDSKDIACTISLQFILRNNKLNLITNMRSNDVLWGTPYDVNAFCFLQEVMASWLGVELGSYFHHVGSMHIYENSVDKLRNTINNGKELIPISNKLFNLNYDETIKQIDMFWEVEESYRNGHFNVDVSDMSDVMIDYLKTIKDYNIKKLTKRDV